MSKRLPSLLLTGLFLLLVACCQAGWDDDPRVIYREKSTYQDIFVVRDGSVVSLKFGSPRASVTQSRVDLSNLRRHMLEYSRLAFAGLLYVPRPERVLVVGLGGGVIPREIQHYYPKAHVEVVEIDPAIPKVARHFFKFPPESEIPVHVADGRKFIEKKLQSGNTNAYDLIVLDAYGEDYVPFHLLTKEFLRAVKGVLSGDGVVVSNLIRTHRLFDSALKTHRTVFRARSCSRCVYLWSGPEWDPMWLRS